MNIFLVLPAYNEQECLQKLLPLLVKYPYSILVVNDCSSDSTLEILQSYPQINVISNKRNLGYSESLSTGIHSAFQFGATHVITLDSDGQHPLEIVPVIVNYFDSGVNCVLTTRTGTKPRFSEQLIGLISQLLWSVSDLYCGMRGFSRSFWVEYFDSKKITPCMEYPFLKALLSGYRPAVIPINSLQRLQGNPRFSARILADFLIFKSFFKSILLS